MGIMVAETETYRISFQLTANQRQLDIRATSEFGEGHSTGILPITELQEKFQKMRANASPATMDALGAELYRALMAGDVAALAHEVLDDATRHKEPVLFELRFDPTQVELARFPWEILSDEPGRFLVREGRADIVRYISYPQPPPIFDRNLISRPILRVFASPKDLDPLHSIDLPITGPVLRHATFDQFEQALLLESLELCGVQFDGHGGNLLQCYRCGQLNFFSARLCVKCGTNLANAKRVGGVAFEHPDGRMHLITSQDFGSVLYNARVLFALLLACETANLVDEIVFNSLAPNLILAGIPIVVGMQFSVKDTFSNRFAESFYKALRQETDILRAVRIARRMNLQDEWYSPAIYMRCRQKSVETVQAKPVYQSRSIDTATPTQVVVLKPFLARLWIRRPDTPPLSEDKLRASINVTDGIEIQTEENQVDIKLSPVEGRLLHRGEVEVTLSANDCQIKPEKIKLFVDEHLDAPAAIFTVQSHRVGNIALNFQIWQDSGLIASIQHFVQTKAEIILTTPEEARSPSTVTVHAELQRAVQSHNLPIFSSNGANNDKTNKEYLGKGEGYRRNIWVTTLVSGATLFLLAFLIGFGVYKNNLNIAYATQMQITLAHITVASIQRTPTTSLIAYQVQPGDSLYSIALKFGVSIEGLLEVNKIQSDAIAPGTTLLIPMSPSMNSAPGSNCIPANTERVRGLVARVLDGESIEVIIGNDMFRVRYIGLNAPGIIPTIEWQGSQAISANDQMVSGQFVTLVRDVSDADANGFLLRYVLVNNLFVNYEMIRQGYARATSMQLDVACDINFLQAQGEAQVATLGIWMPSPIPSAKITSTLTITPVPTTTLKPMCNCNDNLTCIDFATQNSAQACYNYCKVIDKSWDKLDNNHNGEACEGLGD